MRRVLVLALCLLVPVVLLAAACGSDDGADVRSSAAVRPPPDPARDRDPGSGSGSGTGLSLEDTATVGTDDPLILAAVADYKSTSPEDRRHRRHHHDLHRRGPRGRHPGGQGRLRAQPRVVGGDRADRRPDRGDRRRGRRARGRLRGPGRPGRSPAGTASSTCCGSRTPPTARREVRRPARRATSPRSRPRSPTLDIPPAGDGAGRLGADPGGLRGQDHRRGGPLLQDRPLGLRRQRRGRRGDHRRS